MADIDLYNYPKRLETTMEKLSKDPQYFNIVCL